MSIARSPVVLIGTFTAVNNAGVATGPRDAYRICLALANLGIYLANEALHHPNDDAEAFGKIDDFGLKTDKLAVKFLFQPGSTIFISNPAIRAQYKTWLAVIAQHADAMKSCLDIVGHTSATGIPALNDELSVLRAQYVKDELERNDSVLRERLIASGKGSRELIVGTGRDDASDALDRRVEFNVIKCGG